MSLTILMVAEKPSIAEKIAIILSKGLYQYRKSVSPISGVYEYNGQFLNQHAHFKVTSTAGHIFTTDFQSSYNNWNSVSPVLLFDAPIIKLEANPKTRIPQLLMKEAHDCDHLILWLDCDREGENICYEVIECVQGKLRSKNRQTIPATSGPFQQIWRAKFSSLADIDIQTSMLNLKSPNEDESLSVECRQELDLKIGCAFTRYQTQFFQGKYGDLDSQLISYGPCQTPTLFFCVERWDEITAFQSEMFYKVDCKIKLNGSDYSLEWARHRVFDSIVGKTILDLVKDIGVAIVTNIETKEEKQLRPQPLNTVAMLKLASSTLGIGPHQAMQIAERLYLSGLITYPRTETAKYSKTFNLKEIITAQTTHPIWGTYASSLLLSPLTHPRDGLDAGDHPPITPVKKATIEELGSGDYWRIYELITRHFLATVSPDCSFLKTIITFTVGTETFILTGRTLIDLGFTKITLRDTFNNEYIPNFEQGDIIPLINIQLSEHHTTPPSLLSESDLLGLMETFGIGTDASMPTHIHNICERNFVALSGGRRLSPTKLGISLIHGYLSVDPELVFPSIRASIESQCTLIAQGKATKSDVLSHTLNIFKEKFVYFEKKIHLMDTLFEATFTSLANTGEPISRCGVCRRYMKLIKSRFNRLYCPHCENTFNLPNIGVIKLYKGFTCPLDNFELVLCIQKGGKSFPLCPMCYNDPPFGTSAGEKITCLHCAHPTCQHSIHSQGVCYCTQEACSGTLCLDVVSAPNWKLDCNTCNYQLKFINDVHKVSVDSQSLCNKCGSTFLEILIHKDKINADNNGTLKGCIVCDANINHLVESKFSKPRYNSRRQRGGKGRGRGRRGPRQYVDPKMTFSGF